jgi:UDP-N-acetylmuramate dehydrogenase
MSIKSKVDKITLQNISLKKYTSLYVGGKARYFGHINSLDELKIALSFAEKNNLPIFVLGGGSNVLFSDHGFPGLVIKMSIPSIKKVKENRRNVYYKVGAGVIWDDFVKFSVKNELYGIENTSHIPGTVGASVVQNIGAYGQEVSETVYEVNLYDTERKKLTVFKKEEMNFKYRKSILNDGSRKKGRFIVLNVVFCLKKSGQHNLNYKDIKDYFYKNTKTKPTLGSVREAIIEIRNRKFPFPNKPKNGTVGSFWNTEVVDEKKFNDVISKLRSLGLSKKANEMQKKKSVFKVSQGYKFSAGLFVDALGLKGKKVGGARILETHAGVINNFTGKAKASDVYRLSQDVIKKIYDKFGIKFKIEPELVGDFHSST